MAAVRSPIRVVGRYAIYNEIAAGGMATIHLGRLLGPVGFARTVAVKRLHPQYAKDPEFVSMFLDEARLAARVQHPNVVATIDVVATEGELFLIMDYVRGESLSKILRILRRDGHRVPPRIAAAIICGFLHGLHSAHEAKNERGEALGLVHRDVSPQNVLVGADGIARVLDFGIAKAAGRIQVTRDGQIKGKLAYMPPEQLAGREISRAVDIYAAAVVMWETLTMERLFKGETDGATLAKILRDRVPTPSSVHPDLAAFDAAIMRSLSRETAKRHVTAKELALELERCAGIASPTEVGEWVEAIVGPVLSAREDQIAEIESSSAALRVPNRPASPESFESDSNLLPSARAILDAMGTGGSAHSPAAAVARPDASDPSQHGPLSNEATIIQNEAGEPNSREEPTGTSRSRTGWLTSTGLTVPVDRRVPILAGLAGGAVLLIVTLMVVIGRPSRAAPTTTPLPQEAASDSRNEIPPPPQESSSTSSAEPPTDAPPADTPSSAESAKPVEPRPKVPDHVRQPIAHPGPAASPPTTAAGRKNCDPPYTIDAQGRHKYKRECM